MIFGNTLDNIGHRERAFEHKWKRCQTCNGNEFLKNTLTDALQIETRSPQKFFIEKVQFKVPTNYSQRLLCSAKFSKSVIIFMTPH